MQVVYQKGFKAHSFLHQPNAHALFNDIVMELDNRFYQETGEAQELVKTDMTPTTEYFVDFGGMVMVKFDSVETFTLFDGTLIRCFAHHKSQLIKNMGKYEEEARRDGVRKSSSGIPYYKLHGWMGCLIISPEQFDSLDTEILKGGTIMSFTEYQQIVEEQVKARKQQTSNAGEEVQAQSA